jgi:transcriptional regulator with XRE-family HTH domain
MRRGKRSRGRPRSRPTYGRFLSRGSLMLRSWRIEHGISLFEINSRIGLSYDALTRVDRGHNRPGLRLAVALQRLTGIAPREWLEPLAPEERALFEEMESLGGSGDSSDGDQNSAVA